jgi:hypothetical protein
MRCHAPAKSFPTEGQAVAYARRAVKAFRVPYDVWHRRAGRGRLVKQLAVEPVRV